MTKPLNEMPVHELVHAAYGFYVATIETSDDAIRELARRLAELEREVKRQSDGWEEAINIYNMWIERATKAEAEIERMKPVVDAAQRANQSLFVDWDDLDNLKDKVRQYEEGK